jgi:hypothetical protein
MVMTKYEILQSYKRAGQNFRIRDTWVNLGSSTINATSCAFIMDMIYKVDLGSTSTSVLNGALIYCEASYYAPLPPDWNAVPNANPTPGPGIGVLPNWNAGQPLAPGSGSDLIDEFADANPFNLSGGGGATGPQSPTDWENVIVEDAEQGYFSFIDGVITPYFRLLLTADELAAITTALDPTFIPYNETVAASVNIPEDELELIMVEAGLPFLTWAEIEFPRNKVIDLMVKPAMQEYFKYFPINKTTTLQVATTLGNEFRVELPEGAYGVTRAFIVQGGYADAGPIGGNPLYWAAGGNGNGSGLGSPGPSGQGSRLPGYANLNAFTTMALDRAARQGIINYITRVHFQIKRVGNKKYAVGNANKVGLVEIHWAMASNDWQDIEYARQPEVRKLATAKVLRALGMLRSQVKEDIPGQVDYSGFITRAKELEDEVLEFWRSIPRTIAIRGSL